MSDDPFDDELENPDQETPISSRFGMGNVRLAFTRWWVILVFAVVGYVVALYLLSILPPSHEATAVLEVITKEKKLVGAELEMEKSGLDSTIATLANKMLGPTQLRRVAANPKVQALEKAVPPETNWKPRFWREEGEGEYSPAASVSPGELGGMITGWTQVVPRTGTTLVDIIVEHPDAESAVVIANAIVTEYLAAEKARKSGGASDAFTVLRSEAAEAAKMMESAEQSRQIYKNALAISANLTEKRDVLVSLRQRYLPKHPKMIEAIGLYDALNKRFESEMNAVFRVKAEKDYWISRKKDLDDLREIAPGDDADTALPNAEGLAGLARRKDAWATLAQNYLSARTSFLETRITNQQHRYQAVTTRLSEIDVADENNDDDLMLAEPAFPSGSVKSQRLIMLGQGLLGGALAGFGIAYLLGVIDYKIYDVRSVEEATKIGCLAAIPIADAFGDQEEWTSVLMREPTTSNSESIRNLRASVILLGKKDRHTTIVVTSPAPGDGKTTVACELAASFALAGQKTCILDLDLRKPRVHQLFPGLKEQKGTSDVLAGQVGLNEVIRTTQVKDLFVIGSGSKAASPAELLQRDELRQFLDSLAQQFDRVIIDTPPVLPVSDTRLLAQLAQSVILVVRAKRTPVGALIRAIQLLDESHARVVGTVLNALPRNHQGSSYYGYKGYGEYGASGGYEYYGDDK